MNEKLLGDFIKKHNVRDKVFSKLPVSLRPNTGSSLTLPTVASKCGFEVFGVEERRVTNSASHIKTYIDGTIERLGFAPDLYYLHRIDPSEGAPLLTSPTRS